MPDPCTHPDFAAEVQVNRIFDCPPGTPPPPDAVPQSFLADVVVRCSACDTPFKFLGLSSGLDYRGARVSWDGCTAKLALWPGNAPLTPPAPGVLRGYDITGPSLADVTKMREMLKAGAQGRLAVLQADITPFPGEPTLREQAEYLRGHVSAQGPLLSKEARDRLLQIADYLNSLALKTAPTPAEPVTKRPLSYDALVWMDHCEGCGARAEVTLHGGRALCLKCGRPRPPPEDTRE